MASIGYCGNAGTEGAKLKCGPDAQARIDGAISVAHEQIAKLEEKENNLKTGQDDWLGVSTFGFQGTEAVNAARTLSGLGEISPDTSTKHFRSPNYLDHPLSVDLKKALADIPIKP